MMHNWARRETQSLYPTVSQFGVGFSGGFQLLLNVFLTALVAQLLSVEMPDSR